MRFINKSQYNFPNALNKNRALSRVARGGFPGISLIARYLCFVRHWKFHSEIRECN